MYGFDSKKLEEDINNFLQKKEGKEEYEEYRVEMEGKFNNLDFLVKIFKPEPLIIEEKIIHLFYINKQEELFYGNIFRKYFRREK